MKAITEQNIWDLLDGNCTAIEEKHIHEQLQLEENKDFFHLYHTLQVLNNDLKTMQTAQPSANFNAEVMAKLQPTHQAQTATKSDEIQASWKPFSKYLLAAFVLLTSLTLLLSSTGTAMNGGETMGSLGIFLLEGFEKMANWARHPVFFSSISLIYVLGLLTLLDGYLKKKFRYKL
ncbi:MAG: hypothetical protein ACPGVB_08750 [Chitinophagales bacterium]